jgi:hypothetical protein
MRCLLKIMIVALFVQGPARGCEIPANAGICEDNSSAQLSVGEEKSRKAKKKARKKKPEELPGLEKLPELGPLPERWVKYEKDVRLVVNSPYNKAYLSKAVAVFTTQGVNENSILAIASDGAPSSYKGPKLAVTKKLQKFLYSISSDVAKTARANAASTINAQDVKDGTEKALAVNRLSRQLQKEGRTNAVKKETDPLLQALAASSFRSNSNQGTGIIYLAEEEALTKSVADFEAYMGEKFEEKLEKLGDGLTGGLGPAGVSNVTVHYILGESNRASWRAIKGNRKAGYVIHELSEDAVFDGDRPKAGDVLVGLNDKTFAESDDWGAHFGPSVAFGNALEEAETSGRLILNVRRPSDVAQDALATLENGTPLRFTLSVKKAPAFSKRIPFDCQKSDQIADEICSHLAKDLKQRPWKNGYFNNVALLALLSAGKQEYDDLVKAQVKKLYPGSSTCGGKRCCTWRHSSSAIVLCEYYLRTKDAEVLPAIRTLYNILAEGQTDYYGSGHSCNGGDYRGSGFTITAAHTLLAFGLMKKCGIEMDEDRLRKSLDFIRSATVRGTLEYGALRTVQKSGGTADYRYDGSKGGPGSKNGVAALGAHLLGDVEEAPGYSEHLIKAIRHEHGDPDKRFAGLANTHGCKIMGLLWGACAMAAYDEDAYSEILKRHVWHLQLARVPGEPWLNAHPGSVRNERYSAKPSILWNGTYALILNAKKHNLYLTGKEW